MNTYRSDIDKRGPPRHSNRERISDSDVKQSWYTDVAAGGVLSGLRKWWDDLWLLPQCQENRQRSLSYRTI